MGRTFYYLWEVHLMEWFQEVLYTDLWTKLFSFISEFGEELVLIAVMGFFYWGISKEVGKFIGINTIVQLVWNPLIKNIFIRRRPYFDISSIKILKPVDASADLYDISAQGYSFPSGHSSGSASAFWSLGIKTQKKWVRIVCIIIPILVGISRFALGAHYPTDVLGGWALGLFIVIFLPLFQKLIKNEYVFYLVLALIGLPGFFFCTSSDFYTGYGTMIGAFLCFAFDNKVVRFENTSSIFRSILRTLGGGAIYICLNTVLKLPFSKEFLASPVFAAYLVRTVRYIIVIFVTCGVYPMIFKYTSKIGNKKAEGEK